MNIEFRASKSGLTTCSVNGFSVHSNYNPENEAKKFVDNIQADFFPKNIVITGPCLHYLSTFLKNKFWKVDVALKKHHLPHHHSL